MNISDKINAAIREVPDFPIPGVLFKDISPIFLDPQLVRDCEEELANHWADKGVTKVIGIDSRGFLFGPQMAGRLGAGFVMVRKKGKLPPETVSVSYALEYGEATIEAVKGSIQAGDKVVVHDDLLATGGTALAAAEIAQKLGAEVVGFSFIIDLTFLGGGNRLKNVSEEIHSLVAY